MIQPYNEFNEKTGKKIREVRLKREYTRDYLAVQADISSKFLYEIEIGKKDVLPIFCIVWLSLSA